MLLEEPWKDIATCLHRDGKVWLRIKAQGRNVQPKGAHDDFDLCDIRQFVLFASSKAAAGATVGGIRGNRQFQRPERFVQSAQGYRLGIDRRSIGQPVVE
jgi:hypothetical protein